MKVSGGCRLSAIDALRTKGVVLRSIYYDHIVVITHFWIYFTSILVKTLSSKLHTQRLMNIKCFFICWKYGQIIYFATVKHWKGPYTGLRSAQQSIWLSCLFHQNTLAISLVSLGYLLSSAYSFEYRCTVIYCRLQSWKLYHLKKKMFLLFSNVGR